MITRPINGFLLYLPEFIKNQQLIAKNTKLS